MEEALRLKDEQGWSGNQGRVSRAQGTACAKAWRGCPSRAGGTELAQPPGTIRVSFEGTGEPQQVLDKEIRVIVQCGLPEDTPGARWRCRGAACRQGAPREGGGPRRRVLCSDLHPRCLPENCPWRMGSDGSARRAWPAAPRGQRVRAALGDPTLADQPGLWWLESHGDGPGLRGGSQGRASPLARSSGEPSCSCCVLNLGDIRLQTHTCSPNHRLRHPESQVCPLQVTAARGTEARPPPRAPASYSPVRSSGIRCL